jgi:hypothetical protein
LFIFVLFCFRFSYTRCNDPPRVPSQKTAADDARLIDHTATTTASGVAEKAAAASSNFTAAALAGGFSEPTCVAWRSTANCSPDSDRLVYKDKACTTVITDGESGYCECINGVKAGKSTCSHSGADIYFIYICIYINMKFILFSIVSSIDVCDCIFVCDLF